MERSAHQQTTAALAVAALVTVTVEWGGLLQARHVSLSLNAPPFGFAVPEGLRRAW